MKSRAQGKASKASLVARGLAAKSKPPAFKRVHKGQQKAAAADKESKPGYSLYTSDSEDQASSIDRGLNRCAALLSNILDNEDKGTGSTAQSKATTGVAKPVKSTLKRTGPTTQPSVKQGKLDSQRTKAFGRHKVVIPTARADDRGSPAPSKPQEENQGTSTTYNDRLVSSTPVLTSEERQRRQQLQRREEELQQELNELKQRYDLLQRQQDPTHHTEQKLKLQSSMLQELDNHQQKATLQIPTTPQGSIQTQSVPSSRTEQLSNQSSSVKRTSARRSLDYSGVPLTKSSTNDSSYDHDFDDSQSGGTSDLVRRHDDDNARHSVDDSVTQEAGSPESRKRVRIVSPTRTTTPYINEEQFLSSNLHQNVSNSSDEGLSRATRTRHPSSPTARTSTASARSRDSLQPSSAENQARMIQYLADELRALLGGTGDLEVDRLLTEIDDAAKLLPYLMEKDQTTSATQDIEQAVQPFKNENAQLRRKLLIAHQKLKEGSLKKHDKSPKKMDLTFELAACRSVNTVLQKQLTEEKNIKEQILKDRDQLAQSLSELQDEKRKFLQILSNKEQDHLRLKREWQQDTSKVTVENKKLKADLEAVQLSTEADKKEVNILSLSLKQRDAEIERLKELTRGLQQSLARLLSDIQQFQPNGVAKPGGMLDKAVTFQGLDKLLRSEVKTIGQTTNPGLSPEVLQLARRSNENKFSPRLPNRTLTNHENPSSLGQVKVQSEPSAWKTPRKSPLLENKKHLRFAEAEHETTSRKNGIEQHESALTMEDLEEVQNEGDLSSLSSGEEEDFRRDLASLDANIARIQKSLRETALRT